MITFEEVKKNDAIRTYISQADESLVALGYTEHSFAHVTHVAETAGYILTTLGYGKHEIELVKIAAYLHDIGNLVNRQEHSQSHTGSHYMWNILFPPASQELCDHRCRCCKNTCKGCSNRHEQTGPHGDPCKIHWPSVAAHGGIHDIHSHK